MTGEEDSLAGDEEEKTKAVVKEEEDMPRWIAEMPRWSEGQTFESWNNEYEEYKKTVLEWKGKTEMNYQIEEEIRRKLIEMLNSCKCNKRVQRYFQKEIWKNMTVNWGPPLEKIVEKLGNRFKDPDYLERRKVYKEISEQDRGFERKKVVKKERRRFRRCRRFKRDS